MPISLNTLGRVFDILAEREGVRLQCSQLHRPSPEQVFYSVRNSLKHRPDNRYSNILAYDRTAVTVDGHYINANVVTDGKGGCWVAAQAPPPRAFDTFFKALYTGAASGRSPHDAIVVQLTGWEERGIPKADPYILVNKERLDHLSSTITSMQLKGDKTVNVIHYHFDAWPDHGVPQGNGVDALRALVKQVEQRREQLDCEVWVHWTGTFIALSSLRIPGKAAYPSPLGPLPTEIGDDVVAQTVDAVRECRGMMVQNIEQLKLIYDMQ
ncbi:hypothetical protein CI109_105283 [Kwoniella shandongensis]|uniref:Tyrosine-protein phosphatase domain-containing protein n=1 Tax=Kwoniella shandongensis TaxID=1734106 RepID=A0AAJ8LLK1_9TREE